MSGDHDRDTPGSAGHDASVARAWREASNEQPPARLDDAILAAARESVRQSDARVKVIEASPRPRSRWLQWQRLLAAAAVAGLAVLLVPLLPRGGDVAPSIPTEERAPVAAPAMEKQHTATAGPATDATAAAPAAPAARAVDRAPAASGDLGVLARPAAPPPTAADRARRIAAMHAAGDEVGAVDALRAFRADDPRADDYLPESLRDWARTIE